MAEKICPSGKEFVFREPGGRECAKAKNVRELFEKLKSAPLSSVLFHANGSHFTPWLEMLGETRLAQRMRSVKGNSEEVRQSLLKFAVP